MEEITILNLFADELAKKFGRDKNQIIESGLLCTDFKGQIRLVYEDGSYLHFQRAFILYKNDYIGVFTEHCGYFLYTKDDFADIVENAPFAPIYPRD